MNEILNQQRTKTVAPTSKRKDKTKHSNNFSEKMEQVQSLYSYIPHKI